MIAAGHVALVLTAFAALAAALFGLAGGAARAEARARWSGRALTLAAFGSSAACLALTVLLASDAFTVRYVAEHSARAQSLAFKIAALWGGQEGSLLVWLTMLAVMAAVVARSASRWDVAWRAPALGLIGLVTLFFAVVIAVVANPFERLPLERTPPDGLGMNPLLLNPWMLIHPPTLLLGYVGTTFPAALAAAALLAKDASAAWVLHARRIALFTFALLTLGIMLGAYWAYIELGWGGYWGWDPVENASLMPWFVLAGYLHTAIVFERRGMLPRVHAALAFAAFLLSVFGTFLTRSGIISSVHAFGESAIGSWFGAFLVLSTVAAVVLLVVRHPLFAGADRIESLVSREAVVATAIVLLAGTTAIVWLLTMYPAISELASGVAVTPEPMQYTRATRPWLLALLVLTGAAPFLAWGKNAGRDLARRLVPPALAGLAVVAVLAVAGAREPWSLAFFGTAVFVTGAHLAEFVRTSRSFAKIANVGALEGAWRTFREQRRRYGGAIVHIGLVVAAIGIAGSGPYRTEAIFASLAPGDVVVVDEYAITFGGLDVHQHATYDAIVARIDVTLPGSGETLRLAPERRFYTRTQQETTEVSVLPTWWPGTLRESARIGEDLYVILAAFEENGRASLQVLVHPFINWLWIGVVVMLLGTLWAFGAVPMMGRAKAP